MQFAVVPAVALLASLLAFFSGFGLGTILLPAFAVFFPIDVAIAMTAVVHLLNNIFRLTLVIKHISRDIILSFGLITIPAAVLGAWLLSRLAGLTPIISYHLSSRAFDITPVKLTVAVLILASALWEGLKALRSISFSRKYYPVGGLLSGFFGGLSGHQGPLRSAFLVKAGLSPAGYIATGSAVAIMVDIPRLSVYFTNFSVVNSRGGWGLLIATVAAAFAGSLLGNLWLKKVTMRVIQTIITVLLIAVGVALGSGLI